MLDLGTDYGVAPGSSETPRAYSTRLRGHLGEPGGMDEAAHRAAAALTAGFERHRFGPPPPSAGGQDADDGGRTGTGAKDGAASRQLAALELSLRANATLPQRLRAAWLPPSVVGRLGRIVAAPFRAAGRALAVTAKAAARSWPVRSR
jgi:hypothetical protein